MSAPSDPFDAVRSLHSDELTQALKDAQTVILRSLDDRQLADMLIQLEDEVDRRDRAVAAAMSVHTPTLDRIAHHAASLTASAEDLPKETE